MPTYEEFYRQYARRILEALERDGFSPFHRVTTMQLRGSYTLAELKRIKNEIDGLVYEGTTNRLSIEDRNRIYRGLSAELRLPTLQKSIDLCEAASNDDLTDLVGTIDNILKGKPK